MAFFNHTSALLRKEFIVTMRNIHFFILSLSLTWALMIINWIIISKFPPQPVLPVDESTSLSYAFSISSDINQTDILGIPNFFPLWSAFFYHGKCVGIVETKNELTSEFISFLNNSNISVCIFPNEKEMRNYAIHPKNYTDISGKSYLIMLYSAFMFDPQENPNEYSYTLFVSKYVIDDVAPNYISELQSFPQIEKLEHFSHHGHLALQAIADSLILKKVSKVPTAKINYIHAPMYVGQTTKDLGGIMSRFFIPFIFVISGLLAFRELVVRLLEYKTSRMRETMTIMGMKDSSYFVGHFIFYLVEIIITSLINTVIIYIGIFPTINFFIIFIFITLFYLTFFPYTMIIVTLFSTKVSSLVTGIVLYFLIFEVIFVTTGDYLSMPFTKKIVSLIPSIAFTNGLSVLGECKANNINLNFSNIGTLTSYGYSLFDSLFFFILDFIIQMVIALYLDNVVPNLGGMRKGYFFFLDKNYWCDLPSKIDSDKKNESLLSSSDNSFFENPSSELKNQEIEGKCLTIRGLTKIYSNGQLAVNDLNLDIYSGQIFALLGHNGAGKTTTISILCGMVSPTKGSATFMGRNLFEDIDFLRNQFGFCPQHDLLFDSLTVSEHLEIFGIFKNIERNIIRDQINILLADLELEDKRNVIASNLSEGQRRKLSVAISNMGNPTLLMLDEPTAGLDSSSRHELWNILRKTKKNKIIILTTHYMDEADILGDRIAIMSDGKASCCGTPMFLKRQFGIGYNLSISKSKLNTTNQIFLNVSQYISEASIASDSDVETIIKLPFSTTPMFQKLFEYLDNNKENLDIQAYSLDMTTLEDVFLRIGEGAEKAKRESINKKILISDSEKTPIQATILNEEISSLFIQIKLIWWKRAIEYFRYPTFFLIHFLVPIIVGFIILECFSLILLPRSHEYSLNDFPQKQRPLINRKTFIGNQDNFMVEPLSKIFELNFTDISSTETQMNETRRYIQNEDNQATDISNQPPIYPYRYGSYSLLDFNDTLKDYTLLTLFNFSNVQTAINYANIFTSNLCDFLFGVKIKTKIAQFNLYTSSSSDELYSAFNNLLIAGLFAMLFTYTPAFVCFYFVRERTLELKYIQGISGLSKKAYWIGNLTFEIMILELAIGITLPIIYSFHELDIQYSTLLLFCMGPPLVIFSAATSYFFNVDSMAFVCHGILHAIFSSNLPFLPFVIYYNFPGNIYSQIITVIISLIPSCALTSALQNISLIPLYEYINKNHGPFKPLDMDCGGLPFIVMILDIFIFGFLIYFYEAILPKIQANRQKKININELQNNNREKEVLEYENSVFDSHSSKVLSVQNITRSYGQMVAVNKLSFDLNMGEVLVLLGMNGAGKTTTFKLITQNLPLNSGKIVLGKTSNDSNDYSNEFRNVGYCPQQCTLFEEMNVLEHLRFYSILKGIKRNIQEKHINDITYHLKLNDQVGKLAKNLSGGNRRKLTAAISVLGNPALILMDEPSTGIDPKARRQLWQLIKKISMHWKHCAVLIATHLMEEAENLGSKIAVINKNLLFVGSPQYIKDKFGKFYIIEVKLSPEELNEFVKERSSMKKDKQEIIQERVTKENLIRSYNGIKDKYSSAEIIERKEQYLKIRIERNDVSIGSLFGFIEDNKSVWGIKEYAVYQSSLEDIFRLLIEKNKH